MAPVAAYLRLHNFTVFPYIDDRLIMASSYCKALQDTNFVLQMLADHGLQVSFAKSHLQPSQVMDYIGLRLDSVNARVFLPPK